MRKMIGLFALLSLLAPLGVYAAAVPAPLAPNLVLNQIPSSQKLMTPAQPSISDFLQSMNSGASVLPLFGKVCSDSCRQCAGTCPPGEEFCTPNPC